MSPAAAAPAIKIVTFRLGDDLFAADIFAVERVLRYQVPTPIPNVPEWIEGVIEYQGRVLPVIDLRLRFEMEHKKPDNHTRILVFTAAGEWVAATVDQVVEVATVEGAQVAPPPELFRGLDSAFLRGVVRRGERLLIFLDVGKLLSTNDRLILEKATGDAAHHA